MTNYFRAPGAPIVYVSQSAFVRGFIDDGRAIFIRSRQSQVSIRVRARLHR